MVGSFPGARGNKNIEKVKYILTFRSSTGQKSNTFALWGARRAKSQIHSHFWELDAEKARGILRFSSKAGKPPNTFAILGAREANR